MTAGSSAWVKARRESMVGVSDVTDSVEMSETAGFSSVDGGGDDDDDERAVGSFGGGVRGGGVGGGVN